MSRPPRPSVTAEIIDHVADLTAAIMQALPAVNTAVAAHRTDGCLCCAVAADRRHCPTLELATATLDLIIGCWRIRKSLQDEQPRDLQVAVQSGWLCQAESRALSEILDVLDVAAIQADAAGMNLPTLAGIGVAVIDGYRAARAGATG